MDFKSSEEQQAIRKAAEEFAQGELTAERADELLSSAQYPWELLKQAASLGFLGLHFPEKYGGQGYGLLEKVLVIEALCRQDSSLGITLSLSDVGSQWVLFGGSEEQRERILPPLAKGEVVFSAGLSPLLDSVSNDHAVRGHERGKTITLSGKEPLAINAGLAKQILLFGEFEGGERRAFLVDPDQKGVKLEESESRIGASLMPVRAIRLEDVQVPVSHCLPSVDTQAYSALKIEISAQSLGMARGAFEKAIEYARRREAFGRPIIRFQALNHQLADFATRLEASKWLLYHAAWRFDQGNADPRLASMAKLYGSVTATALIRNAIQIHGGYGFLKEYGLERYYRDAWFSELFGGTAEKQRDAIAAVWHRKTE